MYLPPYPNNLFQPSDRRGLQNSLFRPMTEMISSDLRQLSVWYIYIHLSFSDIFHEILSKGSPMIQLPMLYSPASSPECSWISKMLDPRWSLRFETLRVTEALLIDPVTILFVRCKINGNSSCYQRHPRQASENTPKPHSTSNQNGLDLESNVLGYSAWTVESSLVSIGCAISLRVPSSPTVTEYSASNDQRITFRPAAAYCI